MDAGGTPTRDKFIKHALCADYLRVNQVGVDTRRAKRALVNLLSWHDDRSHWARKPKLAPSPRRDF